MIVYLEIGKKEEYGNRNMQLNTSDRSQISSSHRLIESTKKLRHRLDLNGGIGESFSFIEQDYFVKNILHRLKEEAEFAIGKRLQAIFIV